jgi:hypothetical protein
MISSRFYTVCRLTHLRIAVTALCLTACVLLIAFWVRSYLGGDEWSGQPLPN